MKRLPSEFAILGGAAQFSEPLIVGRPTEFNRDRFLHRVAQVLDSGQLTNGGPMVQEFEGRLAAYLGVQHVVAVSNGTAALQVMSAACQLTGEVIVPSMTFIATPHALQWMGLRPVFADIDRHSQTLNPSSVKRCINAKTSAILGVHLWGNPCDVEELQELANQNGIDLLFDSSHAFGCSYGAQKIGSLGKAEAFSFHATKIMQSVEGGAVTTNDESVAKRCRLIRNFGIAGLTQIDSIGINAKMSELSAAAGLTSLESLPDLIRQNVDNLGHYQRELDGIRGLRVAISNSRHSLNAQYVVVCVNEAEFGLSRDAVLNVLRAEGVFARAYFVPGCHNAPPYAGNADHTPVSLPVTDELLDEVLQLPTGITVSESDIFQIGRLLQATQFHAGMLSEQMRIAESHWHPLDPARPDIAARREAA